MLKTSPALLAFLKCMPGAPGRPQRSRPCVPHWVGRLRDLPHNVRGENLAAQPDHLVDLPLEMDRSCLDPSGRAETATSPITRRAYAHVVHDHVDATARCRIALSDFESPLVPARAASLRIFDPDLIVFWICNF